MCRGRVARFSPVSLIFVTPSSAPRPFNRRVALATLGLGALAPGVLAACGGGTAKEAEKKEQPALRLKYQPADAAQNVVPTAPVSVEVSDGWFQQVTLSNSSGKAVAGTFNSDRTVYTTTEPLGYDQTYTWSGSAVGHDGKTVAVAGKFSTVSPSKKISGAFQLADGQTVGIAAPIILQFDAPISDKAAVEKALTVTTNPPVEGSWAWLPDEAQGARAHWRTREYYPAGTTVNVQAKLYGLPFGDGAYGAEDISLNINIGRRQIVKAEVSSHRIQVIRDEGVIMDFPCSYGEADKARNVTRNGIHVVSEKYADFYMSNPAAGYSHVHERWAVRISNNGEFIHANPASAGAQGNTNVTNGCINLSTSDAEQYYQSAIYGDPVEVTGSSIQLSYADGDIWDWAVDWDTWVAMSALPPPTAHPPSTQIPVTAPVTPSNAPTLSGTPTTSTTTPASTGPATPGG
ncbi:L,D-transpeptidase family protein [Mycobacterium avium subsp. hominissuis]|uniref:L,D-transpeptidase n=1 Tax=Mycobacterium avium TaxID=1764 RepID=UPI00313C89F2